MKKDKNVRARHTPLEQRRRHRKVFKSPFSDIERNIMWSSWKDHHLLNMLWACTLVGNMDRKSYLDIFQKIIDNAAPIAKGSIPANLCHNFLSTIEQSTFDSILSPILNNNDAATIVSAIRSVENIPDCNRWDSLLSNTASPDDPWNILANGIGACFDHQSQQATDVRWLKVYYCWYAGKLPCAPKVYDKFTELEKYPNCKNLDETNGLIRATEMALREFEVGEHRPSAVKDFPVDEVWTELFEKTECIYPPNANFQKDLENDLLSEIGDIINKVILQFHRILDSTNIDPRISHTFGVVVYSLSITYEVAITPYSRWATGRILLRTIVECYITLVFLRKKDDPDIWLQYRKYGSGRAAKALLDYEKQEKIPTFLDMEKLCDLANEDAWLETVDINIGHWKNTSTRDLAIEAGIKHIYDQYYEWTSAYTHGQWAAVRDSVFDECLNPLHRRHSILRTPEPMPTVLEDCCNLCNLLLDELNTLYPNDIPKISWKYMSANDG